MNIDIRHLAKLSRLKFSPEEEAKFSGEMEKIVRPPLPEQREAS